MAGQRKILKKIFLTAIFFVLAAGSAQAANYSFNRNLYFGLRGDADVAKLQDALRGQGYFNLQTSTGNYFALTVEAVKKFQAAHGVRPVSGFFGPTTRQAINLMSLDSASAVSLGGATSTYAGKIKIGYPNAGQYVSAQDEYLIIENDNTATGTIDITGFKITNSNGDQFVIPRAHNLPGLYPVAQDEITLNQYGSAKIFTGKQERQINFRENLCTGYFDQNSNFYGKLSYSCPRPSVSANLRLPDHCIQVFEATPSCRTVDQSQIQVAECLSFSEAHFNYQGCVNDNKSRSDFYSGRWLIWMQRSAKFLRDIHDQITLLDRDGKIVDRYSY